MDLSAIRHELLEYDGEEVSFMEVCGSHTAAISKLGIPSILSPKIHLISGPGCPVCVTPSSYVDRLIELSQKPGWCVATFGDLIRVPGSVQSLAQAKGEGAQVQMVYSPFDILDLCRKNREITYVFAAIGFETTTPVYALLLKQVQKEHLENLKLLTALKTMPAAMNALCAQGAPIDGFIAPGHVSVVTGSEIFRPLSEKYQIPVAVAGFTGESILLAIYGLLKSRHRAVVGNFYPSVVTKEGNRKAQEEVHHYFEVSDAVWRGIGTISNSGLCLKQEYAGYDAGSQELTRDQKQNPACCCDKVLIGKMRPNDCPLFGRVCRPMTPQGACMVSEEGSCFQFYSNHRER